MDDYKKALEKELKELDLEIRKKRQESVDYENKVCKLDKTCTAKQKEIEILNKKIAKLVSDMNDRGKELRNKELEINYKVKEQVDIQEQIDKAMKNLAEQEKEVATNLKDTGRLKNDAKKEVERYKELCIQVSDRTTILNNSITSNTNREKELKLLEKELGDSIIKANTALGAANASQDKYEVLANDLKSKQVSIDEAERKLNLSIRNNAQKEAEVNELSNKLNQLVIETNKKSDKLDTKLKEIESVKMGFAKHSEALAQKEKELNVKELRIKKIVHEKGIDKELKQLEEYNKNL